MDSVSFALRKSWLMQTTLSENNELETNKMRPGTWAGEGPDAEQRGSGDTSDGHINSLFSSMG
jgi:hypothetical protein